MTRYAKTIAAILGAISTWGITAGADGGYDQVEMYGLLGAIATVLAVYGVPNNPPADQPADPNVSEQGASLLDVVLALAAVALVVWLLLAFGVLNP